jgi:hypothetical protein
VFTPLDESGTVPALKGSCCTDKDSEPARSFRGACDRSTLGAAYGKAGNAQSVQ